MTDNRTTEPISYREIRILITGFLCEYQNILLSFGTSTSETVCKQNELIDKYAKRIEQTMAATLGNDREVELIRAMEDVLRHAADTVWVGEAETLVDRMVSLGVYGHDVYEGARPWEAGDEAALLPCPWCGGEADVAEFMTRCDRMRFYKVVCNDCYCMGANINVWYRSEAEAISKWNARTHGTLTAQQVRKAVGGHGNIMDNRLYEDWEAVAEELNAETRHVNTESTGSSQNGMES